MNKDDDEDEDDRDNGNGRQQIKNRARGGNSKRSVEERKERVLRMVAVVT